MDQGLVDHGQRQPLAGIAKGRGGQGLDPDRKAFTARAQSIGSARMSIDQNPVQRGVEVEALENQVPQSDQRGEEAVVKGRGRRLEPAPDEAQAEEVAETLEQLGR